MGGKLSKKKKGYCLGAGKDGESTDTTEVEQKETENREGEKDAAEPKGEKAPADQSQNGVNEEQNDKQSGVDVTTGETKEKPEIKASTEQEYQAQGKEQDEGKIASPEQVCEKAKSSTEDKTKTECEVKITLTAAADKPTQESKPVKEMEVSDCKQSQLSETKPLASLQDEVGISEPMTKVDKEQTEKAPASVGNEDNVSEKAAEVPTQAKESIVEVEKVEPSAPVEQVLEPVVEDVVSKPVKEVVEPMQLTDLTKPEATTLPEKVPKSESSSEPEHSTLTEPVGPASKEPELALEPEPSLVSESESVRKPALPEIKLTEAVACELTEQNFKPEGDPELMPCPSETKQEQELTSEPLPPKSTEVPETAEAQKHTENQESLGCNNLGAVEAHTTEAFIEQPSGDLEKPTAPVTQNGPSENSAEDDHAKANPISTELKLEDKGDQKGPVEEIDGFDKPMQQENQVVKEKRQVPIEVLVTQAENDYTTAQDTKETHDVSQHCNSEDKTENNHASAEVKNGNDPSEILEKHGVGNGLPIKEEIKVHLENYEKDLNDLSGQNASHEIQVCNE